MGKEENFGDKINSNGFTSENQPSNSGRKKKIYNILKDKGYSADDIRIAFGEMSFYTLDELKKVNEDNNMPIITRIVANQFYLAYKKGDWSRIKEILDHSIGRPIQHSEVNNLNNPIPSSISFINMHKGSKD